MFKNKILVLVVVAIIVILAVFISYYYFVYESMEDVPEFNEDFWFEIEDGKEYVKTSDGWNFTLNKRQNYSLEGIVLDHLYYRTTDKPYRPINYFSPIDIWVGIDDVSENPDNYDYDVNYFEDREIKWYVSNDYDYFKSHTGLNHLVPHNKEVYDTMMKVDNKDWFRLEGHIIEPYGTRGDETYNWPSDNNIGDYDCEVILVDSFVLY